MSAFSEHCHALARAFDVYVIEHPGMPVEASMNLAYPNGFRVVHVPPIVTERVYCITLHEIGHSAHAMGSLRDHMSPVARFVMGTPIDARDWALQLEAEQAAWDWAEHYAFTWTPDMMAEKEFALRTYQVVAEKAFKGADHPALAAIARRCWPKECHETEGAAQAQLRSIVKRGLDAVKAGQLRVYRCPFCSSFHVGHHREERHETTPARP